MKDLVDEVLDVEEEHKILQKFADMDIDQVETYLKNWTDPEDPEMILAYYQLLILCIIYYLICASSLVLVPTSLWQWFQTEPYHSCLFIIIL